MTDKIKVKIIALKNDLIMTEQNKMNHTYILKMRWTETLIFKLETECTYDVIAETYE